MKSLKYLGRQLVVGGLAVALLGGVAAQAAGNDKESKNYTGQEHRQAMRAMREKMLADAKAEDAALQKLIAQLNAAPEAQKTDLEVQILNRLVAEPHQRLTEWDAMHDQMAAFRHEHMQASGGTGKLPHPEQR